MNTYRKPARKLEGIKPYDPKSMPAKVVLSANESPYQAPSELHRAIQSCVGAASLNRYPDPLAETLRRTIAQAHNLAPDQVLVGNGGDELLFNFVLAWGGAGRIFLNMPPTFSVYEHNARITDTRVVSIPRKADFSINEEAVCDRVAFGDIDFIVVTSPNNPTGNTADPSFIKRLLESSDAMVLVDEAYFEFAGATVLPWLNRYKNLAILRTLSKAYGLAGVRLGYLLAHADVISELLKVRQPYSVDTVSQLIGTCVLEQRAAFDRHIAATIDQRDLVFEALGKMGGVRPYPSDANFILFRLENASKVWESLYSRGVLVRDFSRERGLKNCLRVTIGTPDENRCFLDVLEDILAQEGDSHGK